MPKISALPAGTTPDGTEKIPAVQNGVTVEFTVSQIATPLLYFPDQTSFTGSLAFGDGLRALSHVNPAEGQFNIAIGMGVQPLTSTGYYNIGIGGDGTAGLITTGHGNIVIGRSAGFNITSGLDNTIVGGSAGLVITTELDNCAFGVNALRNIAGAENCAFGGDTGLNSVSGNQNIFIGGLAARFLGDNATGKTTGDLGIYIGYNSHASADGLTNEIVIGNAATGLGSNTVVIGNDSVIKTRMRGTVLIDTSTVDATFNPRLQIKSTTVDAVNPVPLIVLDRLNSTTPAMVVGVDASGNPTIAVNGGGSLLFGTHAAGNLTFTQGMSLTGGVADVATGFKIGGSAASGNLLVGNGTNFVSTAASTVTAGNATNIGVTDDNTTNATMNVAWFTSNAGNLPAKTSSSKLLFNPSTGALGATSFAGAGTGLTGTAASLTAGNATLAASATKLATARNIDGQAFDGTAAITVIAPGTHAASSKTTPVDADELPLVDSASSNVLAKLTWANLKATIKAYYDAVTSTLTNKTFDTAGAGNSLSINGVAVTANTGTGAVARAAGPTFTTPALGAATGTSLAVTAGLTSSGATAGIGYATGAGGTVTQATNKTTGVTLNTVTGVVTMNNAALAANTSAPFLLTNSAVGATDLVMAALVGGYASGGTYRVLAEAASAGQVFITLTNTTAGSLSEAVQVRFAVIKCVNT